MKGIFDYWRLQGELLEILEAMLQYDIPQEVRDRVNVRIRQLNKEYSDWKSKNSGDDSLTTYLDRINTRYETD